MTIRECIYIPIMNSTDTPFGTVQLGGPERQVEFNFEQHKQLELFHDRDLPEMLQGEVAQLQR
jgi:hypothetical protein